VVREGRLLGSISVHVAVVCLFNLFLNGGTWCLRQCDVTV
jgi:hypothetical protein